jgi:hypothetical protein
VSEFCLKMEPASSSETFVPSQQTTWALIPEGSNLIIRFILQSDNITVLL